MNSGILAALEMVAGDATATRAASAFGNLGTLGQFTGAAGIAIQHLSSASILLLASNN